MAVCLELQTLHCVLLSSDVKHTHRVFSCFCFTHCSCVGKDFSCPVFFFTQQVELFYCLNKL
ncbi:hypothetical protein X975_19822, partial [Stegodyphus mimosarum]